MFPVVLKNHCPARFSALCALCALPTEDYLDEQRSVNQKLEDTVSNEAGIQGPRLSVSAHIARCAHKI